jgi:transposase
MGKNTLHMIGPDSSGAIVLREKVSRGRIALRFANLPPCLLGIEAGMATHYVARELTALGQRVNDWQMYSRRLNAEECLCSR